MFVIIMQDGNTTQAIGTAKTLEKAKTITYQEIGAREDFGEKGIPEEILWESNGNINERAILTGMDADDYVYFILEV